MLRSPAIGEYVDIVHKLYTQHCILAKITTSCIVLVDIELRQQIIVKKLSTKENGFIWSISEEIDRLSSFRIEVIVNPYPMKPRVISIKGTQQIYGKELEKAPRDLVYIGRVATMGGWKLKASKWANPFKADGCVGNYRDWIVTQPELIASLPELRGKVLCCWCKDKGPNASCHGDILAELVN